MLTRNSIFFEKLWKVIYGIQFFNLSFFLFTSGYRRVLFAQRKLPDIFFAAFKPVFLRMGRA